MTGRQAFSKLMIQLSRDEWEVCMHRHTPSGTMPDLSGYTDWGWRSASIPFDAISWLHHNDNIPDPMVETNDLLFRWVEDVDWVLRKQFQLSADELSPDDEMQLTINNVDCYFEMFLNGCHIGTGGNQFREHIFDLDEKVLQQENELLLYIRSARNVNSMLEAAYGQLPAGFDSGRVHSRRCQSLTGWDWTARLSSVSVIESPAIRTNLPIEILHPYAFVSHLPAVAPGQETVDRVQVNVVADIAARRRASGDVTVQVTDLETGEVVASKTEKISIKPKPSKFRTTIELESPKLWWSLGLGHQPLYQLEIVLNGIDRLENTFNLRAHCDFGIRTITIEARKDELGESFTPLLNGVPVFCRGANWIPVKMLPAGVDSSDYRILINSAVGAGVNCLRVWGGGIYESDLFYQLCDQAGILVWQDFMFSCAAYPTYRGFLDEVEAEAIFQVTRLRNHPCIMIWCGNSENEWLHQTGGLKKGSEQKIIGETIWSHLVREIVEDKSPSVTYHQSSPFGKNRLDYNDQASGDRHSWGAWAEWLDTDTYLQDNGRFISEFGMQAYPSMDSVQEFANGADEINFRPLAHHQKMIEGQERLVRYVAAHYKLPATLNDWIVTTQQMQAEILRRAAEHWRRRRFNTSGALVWQLHDAYTAISWSLVDYYRRPKLAWYACKKFFAPVLLSMELRIGDNEAATIPPELWPEMQPTALDSMTVEGGELITCQVEKPLIQVRFVIINDTSLQLTGELVVEFRKSQGDPLILDTVTVAAGPNAFEIGLIHDIGPALMADIKDLVVRAHWNLTPDSKAALDKLGDDIRAVQKTVSDAMDEADNHHWNFDAEAGLSLTAPLVEPKYAGIAVNPEVQPSD